MERSVPIAHRNFVVKILYLAYVLAALNIVLYTIYGLNKTIL